MAFADPMGKEQRPSQAKVIHQAGTERRQRPAKADEHVLDLQTSSPRNLAEAPNDLRGLHLVKHEQVILRVTRLDSPWCKRFDRKVLQVEGEDQRTFASDRRGKYMTILGIVCEARQKAFIVAYHGLRKGNPNLRLEQFHQMGWPLQLFRMGAAHFGQHLVRPMGYNQARTLREAQQEVTDAVVCEDASVEEDPVVRSHSGACGLAS